MPIPPLAEQKAIVETVNTLFKEVEALEKLTVERVQLKEDFIKSALRELSTGNTPKEWAFLQEHFSTFMNEESNIKKLRETILQLAVQGKLTRAFRECHPELVEGSNSAKTLLASIKAEKEQLIKEKKIKKEKPLPAISEDEIPYELPASWEWCRFGDIVRFMAYGTSEKTNDNYNLVPVLRMGNITTDGRLLYRNLKYISSTCKDLPKAYLEHGDLVFNRTNSYELVGKSAVFKGDENSYTLASYLIKVSPFVDCVSSDYLNNYIISKVCRSTQIEPQITAQTNQANFSGSKLKSIMLPLPPLVEQEAIVEKINSLMALCDELEKQVVASKANAEKLMQSVLREVFQGKPEPKPYPVIEEEIVIANED